MRTFLDFNQVGLAALAELSESPESPPIPVGAGEYFFELRTKKLAGEEDIRRVLERLGATELVFDNPRRRQASSLKPQAFSSGQAFARARGGAATATPRARAMPTLRTVPFAFRALSRKLPPVPAPPRPRGLGVSAAAKSIATRTPIAVREGLRPLRPGEEAPPPPPEEAAAPPPPEEAPAPAAPAPAPPPEAAPLPFVPEGGGGGGGAAPPPPPQAAPPPEEEEAPPEEEEAPEEEPPEEEVEEPEEPAAEEAAVGGNGKEETIFRFFAKLSAPLTLRQTPLLRWTRIHRLSVSPYVTLLGFRPHVFEEGKFYDARLLAKEGMTKAQLGALLRILGFRILLLVETGRFVRAPNAGGNERKRFRQWFLLGEWRKKTAKTSRETPLLFEEAREVAS